MRRLRLELSLEMDPHSVLDRSELVRTVEELKTRLDPVRWAILECLALEVSRVASVDLETRRQLLHLARI